MQQLPNSEDSEIALLGCMLIDDNIINLVDLIESDFYNPLYGKIYNLMKNIKGYGKTVDLVVIKEYLEKNKLLQQIGGITFLVNLIENTPNSKNFKEYVSIIKEKSNRRKIINYARSIEKMGYEENKEVKDILQKVENISSDIFDLGEVEEELNLYSYVNAFGEMRDKIIERKGMLGIPTIFPIVDKYTKGQQEGKVVTLAAYSNVGKSKISYSYVSNFLKQGKKVMYISLEVGKDMLFSNILANYYNKHYSEVLKEDFIFDLEHFENLEIYDKYYKLEDIKTLIKSKLPDIVFIDFIQNIQTQGTETEKMTRVAQEIQQLSITSGISFFNLSQANNESRFKGGEAIQPKGSGAIFASTDVLFTLHRENGELIYTIAKNKYGPAFKKFLILPDETFSNFTITELTEEQLKNKDLNF